MNNSKLKRILESRGSVRISPINENKSAAEQAGEYIAKVWDVDLAKRALKSYKEGKIDMDAYNKAATPFFEPKIKDLKKYKHFLNNDIFDYLHNAVYHEIYDYTDYPNTLRNFIDLMVEIEEPTEIIYTSDYEVPEEEEEEYYVGDESLSGIEQAGKYIAKVFEIGIARTAVKSYEEGNIDWDAYKKAAYPFFYPNIEKLNSHRNWLSDSDEVEYYLTSLISYVLSYDDSYPVTLEGLLKVMLDLGDPENPSTETSASKSDAYSGKQSKVFNSAIEFIANNWNPSAAKKVIDSDAEGEIDYEAYNKAAYPFMEPEIDDVEVYQDILDSDVDKTFANIYSAISTYIDSPGVLKDFIELMKSEGY